MKSIPPQHAVLPVLTERLPADLVPLDPVADPSGGEAPAAPRAAEVEAQLHAVVQPSVTAPAQTVDVDLLWAQIASELQQRLSQAVRAELQALAPQLEQRLWQVFEQAVRDALAQSVRPR